MMNMKTYTIKIKPISPFVTPLQSDTIFGQMVWMIKFLYNKDEMLKFLNNIKENKGVFAISAGFKENKIPFPFIPMPPEKEIVFKTDFFKKLNNIENLNLQDLDKEKLFLNFKKRLKKVRKYIKLQDLNQIIDVIKDVIKYKDVLNDDKFFKEIIEKIKNDNEYKKNNKDVKNVQTEYILRNTINRLTCTTLQKGGLFSVRNTFYNENYKINIFIKTDLLSADKIKEIFVSLGKYGFGADASTGKGQFEFEQILENDINEPEDYNFILNLSSYIPDGDEVNLYDSYYELFVKRGKLGGEYACGVNGEEQSFFKVPLIMIKEGSLLKINKKKKIYGKLVDKVNNAKEEIVQCGIAFDIKLKLDL